MPWYAVYFADTGKLFSTGSRLPPLRVLELSGLRHREFPRPVDTSDKLWDAELRAFVDKPEPPPGPTLDDLAEGIKKLSRMLAEIRERQG